MNFFKILFASLYRRNCRNANKDIPYSSTICYFYVFLFINFVSFLCIINVRHFFDFWQTEPTYIGYLEGMIIIFPQLFLIGVLLPHKKLKEWDEKLTEKEYKIGKWTDLAIIIVTFLLFVVVV